MVGHNPSVNMVRAALTQMARGTTKRAFHFPVCLRHSDWMLPGVWTLLDSESDYPRPEYSDPDTEVLKQDPIELDF